MAETGTASALLAKGCDFLHIFIYSKSTKSTSTMKHAAATPPMRPAYCFRESKRMGRDRTGIKGCRSDSIENGGSLLITTFTVIAWAGADSI